MKSISILGSTGSIGKSTVSVIKENRDKFTVSALVAGSNTSLLAEQAKDLGAKLAVVADETKYNELKENLADTNIKVAAGKTAVLEAAAMDADIVMSSIVGAAGLEPTAEVIKRGKTLALANKETLVCAGEIVMQMIKDTGTTLLPVDSEHSAIFQCLNESQRDKGQVAGLVLTASGGPFRDKDLDSMAKVTPEQAVSHPNWSMGAKISVDSATMMNKGLEIIEAYHLFGLPLEKIKVVVHPQSIIHSAVSYIDGSVLAQLGNPDMRTPISYALGFPNRIPSGVRQLDLAEIGTLSFFSPDETRFPSLRLAKSALAKGSFATNVLNAANEVAVAAFLAKRIPFLAIANTVSKVLESTSLGKMTTIADAIALDAETRIKTKEIINKDYK